MKYRSNSFIAYVPRNQYGKLILKQALAFQKVIGMRMFLIDIIRSNFIFTANPGLKRNQIRHQNELEKFTDFINETLKEKLPENIIPRIGWGRTIRTLILESELGGYEFVILDKGERRNTEGLTNADVDRFVSKSFCPVLLLDKNQPIEQIKQIVIPVDISQQTQKRLYWASFFAKKFDATIKIISALNIDIQKTKSLAFKNADKLRQMLEARGVKCEVEILKVGNKEKHTAILDYIKQDKPQLIIIRRHEEIRFSGRRIGKFVSEIIHGSSIPVFTVGGVTPDFDIEIFKKF